MGEASIPTFHAAPALLPPPLNLSLAAALRHTRDMYLAEKKFTCNFRAQTSPAGIPLSNSGNGTPPSASDSARLPAWGGVWKGLRKAFRTPCRRSPAQPPAQAADAHVIIRARSIAATALQESRPAARARRRPSTRRPRIARRRRLSEGVLAVLETRSLAHRHAPSSCC